MRLIIRVTSNTWGSGFRAFQASKSTTVLQLHTLVWPKGLHSIARFPVASHIGPRLTVQAFGSFGLTALWGCL